MAYRFFVPHDSFSESESLQLGESEYHHARHVLRLLEGELVHIHNGKGACATARIQHIERHSMSLRIEEVSFQPPPPYPINLILAYLRPNHLDFALEKCTELGIDSFSLYHADTSDHKEMARENKDRHHRIVLAALKQSGRLFLPTITSHNNIQQALSTISLPCLHCDLTDTPPYIDDHLHTLSRSSITIVVGPESGFSSAERDFLKRASSQPVLLSENTLRAETAAVCACFAASLWRRRL